MKKLKFLFVLFYFITQSEIVPAQVLSSTAVQVVNNSILPGSDNQAILRIAIEVGSLPVTITNMTFDVNGCTIPMGDIESAKLYHYNDSSVFNITSSVLIGTYTDPGIATIFTFLTPPFSSYIGLSSYNNLVPLTTNYFWLIYNMTSFATVCDTVDAWFEYFTANSVIIYPTVVNPPGFSIIGICPTGEEELTPSDLFKVYPIPTQNEITINFTSENMPVNIELFDMAGKKLETIINGLTREGGIKITYPLSALKPGIYILRIESGGESTYKSVIKL